MPKEITHWILAERTLEALPSGSSLRETVARHREAYLGGAVLPDTLAHIFKGAHHPMARRLSQRFHDPDGNSYAPLIAAEARFPEGMPPALFSCFLGVVSHMEADIALHPYVYGTAASDCIGEHYRIETEIDVDFLSRGSAPSQRRLDTLLGASTREVLASAAGLLFDPEGELPREALEHSVALHCRFQSMYDRFFWKMAVRLLARVCGSPFREQRHLFYPVRRRKKGGLKAGRETGWRHPESGEWMTLSLEDLARQAVRRTVEVFGRIEKAGSFAAALADPPGANLLTGLPGVKKGA